MRMNVIAGVLSAVAVAACTAPSDGGSTTQSMADLDRLLDIAPSLSRCTAANVSAKLGVNFVEVKRSASTVTYEAGSTGVITDYELREPTAMTGGMLIAEVRPKTVDYWDTVKSLGWGEGAFVSYPEDPEVTWLWEHGRTKVFLSYLQKDDDYLSSLAVHCD